MDDDSRRRDRAPRRLPGIYAVIVKPDFALIIPEESDGFHLVEQYRYPTGLRIWEFPGTLATGHDGSRGAPHTELAEETGLTGETLRHLGHLHGAHSMTGQALEVFHATDLTHG